MAISLNPYVPSYSANRYDDESNSLAACLYDEKKKKSIEVFWGKNHNGKMDNYTLKISSLITDLSLTVPLKRDARIETY